MRQLLSIAVALLASAAPRTQAAILAGPLTNAATQHVYYLLGPNDWTKAEAEAVSLGGHLVTINDAAEQEWVFSTFGPLAGSHWLWIGLTDRDVEGTFQWVSGETSTYRNWVAGEPNNAGPTYNQDYAHTYPISHASPGMWDDRAETETAARTAYAVAEVNAGVPTEVRILEAVEIAWPTQTTNSYQLQWSLSLETNDWYNLGTPIQGTGSTNYYFDAKRARDRRFYRVLTQQP